MSRLYKVIDVATGRYMSQAAFLTRESALETIEFWRQRHVDGIRTDTPYERYNRMIVVEYYLD